MEIEKTAKMKNAEKADVLTRAVSTVVFTNSVVFFCVSFNFAFFAENTIKYGFQQKKQNSKVKKWSKLKLKSGPIMLRNIIGPLFLTLKRLCFFVFFFGLFFKNPLQGERVFRKQKQRKTKQLDHFLTLKRAKIGPLFNFTAYIYML